MRGVDERPEAAALLASIKVGLPDLENLLKQCTDEAAVYRFYHQSFKVYGMQEMTFSIVRRLQALQPDRPLNPWFLQIVVAGTGKKFEMEHNQHWLEMTRPMLEAFFHARYFLEMVCRYGRVLDAPPNIMPTGWAAVLYLYNLR